MKKVSREFTAEKRNITTLDIHSAEKSQEVNEESLSRVTAEKKYHDVR